MMGQGGGTRVRIRSLTRRYETVSGEPPLVALERVDLEIEPGERVAVMGTSGSGKSTLLHLVGALDQPSGGGVELDGQELACLSGRERAELRRSIGMVFQDFRLLPTLSALENVAAPLVPTCRPRLARTRAQAALEEVGLGQRLRALPRELSGGQQQRVALARALIVEPALLLADEPTGNLDPATGSLVLELLLELGERRGATLLLVTHDAAVAACCERTVRLEEGRLVETM
jgi:putative ABC transport system ATP-binding protein